LLPILINLSPERSSLTPIFIDTAYVIALLNRRDQYHVQALKLAQQDADHPLLVTSAVVLEIGNALSQHYIKC
jgi:uncharacterized protein